MPVLYFFFRKIIDANHDSDAALRDWLTQALPFSPPLQSRLKRYLGEDIDSSKKNKQSSEQRNLESLSMFDLWQDLRSALSHLPQAYIVVDALDEMNQSTATEQFLQDLNQLSQWRPSRIKVLMTSRPIATIERALRMEKLLCLKMEEKAVDSDIAFYVRSRLVTSTLPTEHYEAVQAAVPGKANGLFLYAKLAMNEILADGAVVNQVIQNLPSNLNIMYSRILRDHAAKTGISHEIQVLVMQVATHSTRPLRLIEMADLIANAFPAEVPDLKAGKNVIRSFCGPLLDILPDETLCVVHHSLTEFLTGKTRSDSHDFPILEGSSTHSRLAIMCLHYLQSGCLVEFKVVPRKEYRSPWGRVSNQHEQLLAPYTRYAATNWHVHAKKTSVDDPSQGDIHITIDKFASHSDFEKWAAMVDVRTGAKSVTPMIVAAIFGLTEYAKLIISRSGFDVDDGAPICEAAARGFTHIVEALHCHGADLNRYTEEGYTALHLAAMNNHAETAAALLRAGCEMKLHTKLKTRMGDVPRQRTALEYACIYGHTDTVEAILSFIKTTERVSEALLWAVESKRSNVAEKILKHPMADVNEPQNMPPLFVACSKRDLQTIKVLIAAGAKTNHPEHRSGGKVHRKLSPLYALSAFENYISSSSMVRPVNTDFDPEDTRECFSLLIKAGANVHELNADIGTPLHVARDSVAAAALLSAGADANQLNRRNESPAHVCGNIDVLRVLVEVGQADLETSDSSGQTPLLKILQSSNGHWPDCPTALQLLDLGACGSAVDNEGNTAIHHAIKHFEPTTKFVDFRTNTHLKDLTEQLTSLLRRLCESGADVNRKNNKDEAPIYLTSFKANTGRSFQGTLRRLEALVSVGANLVPADDTSRTVLFRWTSDLIAAAKEDELPELDKIFQKYGGRYDITDDRGRTLVHEAVTNTTTIKFLIEKGVDPDATDNEGNTFWHEIVPKLAGSKYNIGDGPPKIFIELLQMGANPQAPNDHGKTPLHILSSLGPFEHDTMKRSSYRSYQGTQVQQTTAFDVLLSYYKPNVDCEDRNGITPLHLASTYSEYLTRKLLDAGANPSRANREGLNAFHISARSRTPNISGMLLDHMQTYSEATILEAINMKDTLGRTPLYYACESGSFEIAKMLVEAGADVEAVDYEISPWKGCAIYEREAKSWKSDRTYPRLQHAGSVLLADRVQSNERTYHFQDRIEDLVIRLASRTTTQQDFVDMAIHEVAEEEADYTVEVLLRGREMMNMNHELHLTGKILESVERRRAARGPDGTLCNCGKSHKRTDVEKFMLLNDWHRIPDILSPSDQIHGHRGVIHGTEIVEMLVSRGLASAVQRMLTPESFKKVDDQAWLKEQKSLYKSAGGYVNDSNFEPLLFHACSGETPNMEVIRVLVENLGINVNAHDRHGESALHFLARGEHWWHIALALPYLLQRGANIESKNQEQETPLNAVLNGCGGVQFTKKSVELLVKHGADVNSVDHKGNSCLAKALCDRELSHLLLENGATVAQDVLIQAFELDDLELLRFLLSNGADPNVYVPKGTNSIAVSVEPKTENAVSAKIWREGLYPLHHMIMQTDGKRPVSEIAQKCREKMVQLMLEYGATPCAKYNGTTVLHELLRLSWAKVDLLFNTPTPNLDLEVQDFAGDTPLLLSCRRRISSNRTVNGQTIIALLLSLGANIRAQNNAGTHILHHFAEGRGFKEFEPIISSVSDLINEPDNAGDTPLHLAVARGAKRQIDLFISNGGDVQAIDAKGNTMLHLLMQSSYSVNAKGVIYGNLPTLFHRFLSLGLDINARNNAGETPIFSFFRHGKIQYYEPRVNRSSERLPLDSPTQSLEDDLPKYLEQPIYKTFTDAGVDWRMLNSEGQNLLHIVAATNTSLEPGTVASRFKALMDMGLDPGMEDVAQRTPVDVAAELKNREVLELFSEK